MAGSESTLHITPAGERALRDELIVQRYLEGLSSDQLAAEFGLAQPTISKIIRRAGKTRDIGTAISMALNRPEVKLKLSSARKGAKCPEHVKEALRKRVGPLNHNWISGMAMVGGYLAFTASEANGAHQGRFLHMLIAEWKVGRRLQAGEHVHHKDGNKLNNDPSNLQVMSASEHTRFHALKSGLGRKKWRAA